MKHNKVIALLMLMFPLGVHAQEFIRADNIFDLMFVVENGDTVRLNTDNWTVDDFLENWEKDKRHIWANNNYIGRHEAISDSLADIIIKSDTIQVLSYHNSVIQTYDEVILSNGMYYEWGDRDGISIISADELESILIPTWAAELKRILSDRVIYTDSIRWEHETPLVCYLDRFIMILPGLYEHTRYGYAISPPEIYYGPLDRK